MRPAQPYYRPRAHYIGALQSWSEPLWHIRKEQDSLFGTELAERTKCGVTVRADGVFSENATTVKSLRCKKCFG